jgi:hypothetical protein
LAKYRLVECGKRITKGHPSDPGLADAAEDQLFAGPRPAGDEQGAEPVDDEQEQADREEVLERDLLPDVGGEPSPAPEGRSAG